MRLTCPSTTPELQGRVRPAMTASRSRSMPAARAWRLGRSSCPTALSQSGSRSALPWGGRRFLGRSGLSCLLGWFGPQDSQALTVAGNSPFGGLAEVVPQMPPVSDLDGLGCSGCGAFREERCSVPADDLDAGAFRQPVGQSGRFPVGISSRSMSMTCDRARALASTGAGHGMPHTWGRRTRVRCESVCLLLPARSERLSRK